MQRLQALCLCVVIGLVPSFLYAAPPIYLTDVRIEPANNYESRIIFELTQQTTGKVKFLYDPYRVTVEFKNTAKQFSLDHLHLKDPLITSIQESQAPENDVHFTFYVNQPVQWHVNYVLNKRINTVNLQLDLVGAKPTQHSFVRRKIEYVLSRIAAHANANVVAQDRLARARLAGDAPKPIAQAMLTRETPYTVVIDAGHGGKDTGAIGIYGIQEKMVVLRIARMVAKKINAIPGMHAVLTRDDDVFVPLRQRLELARKGKADLFIAIHADSYFDAKVTGASVYALSKRGATSEASRWLAKRDNESELGDVDLGNLKDRSLLLRSILIDLAQTTTIKDSLRLGNIMLDALDDVTSLKYKRVEQAPFVVLKSPDIPSILIETGFITNPYEEKRLSLAFYQDKIATCIANGVKRFVEQYLAKE